MIINLHAVINVHTVLAEADSFPEGACHQEANMFKNQQLVRLRLVIAIIILRLKLLDGCNPNDRKSSMGHTGMVIQPPVLVCQEQNGKTNHVYKFILTERTPMFFKAFIYTFALSCEISETVAPEVALPFPILSGNFIRFDIDRSKIEGC